MLSFAEAGILLGLDSLTSWAISCVCVEGFSAFCSVILPGLSPLDLARDSTSPSVLGSCVVSLCAFWG